MNITYRMLVEQEIRIALHGRVLKWLIEYHTKKKTGVPMSVLLFDNLVSAITAYNEHMPFSKFRGCRWVHEMLSNP